MKYEIGRRGRDKGTKPKNNVAVADISGAITYFVIVANARNLDNEDTNFLWIQNYDDVFVAISGYGVDDEKVLKTETIDGSTEPEWSGEPT